MDLELYEKDLEESIKSIVGLEELRGKRVLITGSTGTIGRCIVDTLLQINKSLPENDRIKLFLGLRNLSGREIKTEDNCSCFDYDLNSDIQLDQDVDYVIHAAGNAHPKAFVSDPVGTITGNVKGTFKLLEYSREHGVKRFLYVSSGEVYGQGDLSIDSFEETYGGYVDPVSPRSCYPMSKRAAETLCASYYSQYALETVIVRPSHTFGPFMTASDSRVHAEFLRKAAAGEDIVLKSRGSQVRSYTYVADCVSGLLSVLLSGKPGQAYNLSNEKSICSISELAEKLAVIAGVNTIYTEPDDEAQRLASPIARQVLDNTKLKSLGWDGAFNIYKGMEHAVRILKNNN